MRINNGLGGFSSRQTSEQFRQARLVRITHGRFAIWLDPFGVLNPKVVVNLLPEVGVGGIGSFVEFGASVSAFRSETNEFHKRLSVSRLTAPNPRGTRNIFISCYQQHHFSCPRGSR